MEMCNPPTLPLLQKQERDVQKKFCFYLIGSKMSSFSSVIDGRTQYGVTYAGNWL